MASSHPCCARPVLKNPLDPGSGHRTKPCTQFDAVLQSTMSVFVLRSRFWGGGPPMRSRKQKAQTSLDAFSHSSDSSFFNYQKPFLAGSISSPKNANQTSDRSPNLPSNHTFNRHFRKKSIPQATSDGSDLSLQPPSLPLISHSVPSNSSSRTLSSLLGAIFTVGDAPALAADQAPASSGEPVHTAAWLMVVAVLAAVGWALKARWESILNFLVS